MCGYLVFIYGLLVHLMCENLVSVWTLGLCEAVSFIFVDIQSLLWTLFHLSVCVGILCLYIDFQFILVSKCGHLVSMQGCLICLRFSFSIQTFRSSQSLCVDIQSLYISFHLSLYVFTSCSMCGHLVSVWSVCVFGSSGKYLASCNSSQRKI